MLMLMFLLFFQLVEDLLLNRDFVPVVAVVAVDQMQVLFVVLVVLILGLQS